MTTSQDDEVDRNFEAFLAMLPDLIDSRRGQYALLRQQQVEGFHKTLRAAIDAASRFADQPFSIQEVTDRPADLGLFSHAVNTRFA